MIPSIEPAASSPWCTETRSREDTEDLGVSLASLLESDDVVILTGDLGAGKTQFAKGVARGLGSKGTITSPTFNILLIHEGGRLPFYHFDLYRLDGEWQLDDIDYFGMIEDGAVSVVEWGDRFPHALPQTYLDVRITLRYRPSMEETAQTDSDEALSPIDQTAPVRAFEVRGVGARGRCLSKEWAKDLEIDAQI